MAKIYWDTNLFIYLFEQTPVWGRIVRELNRRMRRRSDELLTGVLTLGEILVRPLAMNNSELVEAYSRLFRSPSLKIAAFNVAAARRYAEIRQDRAIGVADGIQLACAAAEGVDLFITNDRRLMRKVIPGINFVASLDSLPL